MFTPALRAKIEEWLNSLVLEAELDKAGQFG